MPVREARYLKAKQRSGWKRPPGRNLGEHRQGTALWQHVQRYRHQVDQFFLDRCMRTRFLAPLHGGLFSATCIYFWKCMLHCLANEMIRQCILSLSLLFVFTVVAVYLSSYSLRRNSTRFFERLLKWLPLPEFSRCALAYFPLVRDPRRVQDKVWAWATCDNTIASYQNGGSCEVCDGRWHSKKEICKTFHQERCCFTL